MLIGNFRNKSGKDKKKADDNYEYAVKSLNQWTSIDAAVQKFFANLNIQKLDFSFHKLIILTDGVGLGSVSDAESLYLAEKKQFGLSTIVLLLGI